MPPKAAAKRSRRRYAISASIPCGPSLPRTNSSTRSTASQSASSTVLDEDMGNNERGQVPLRLPVALEQNTRPETKGGRHGHRTHSPLSLSPPASDRCRCGEDRRVLRGHTWRQESPGNGVSRHPDCPLGARRHAAHYLATRSEEHTSELQSR